MDIEKLRAAVEAAWDEPSLLQESRGLIEETVDRIDLGEIRTADQTDGAWIVNQWVKKAMMLFMKLRGHSNISVRGGTQLAPAEHSGFAEFPLKAPSRLQRVFMPIPSVIRHGSYIADDARVLDSYVSMGVYIGARTMVVNGSTVGLCAQVGADVFISSGSNIGSVMMMPLCSRPVILEDGVYIGMNGIVSEGTDPYFDAPTSSTDEGVVVGAGAILGANVVINRSTPLIDMTSAEPREVRGQVPPNAVVIAGCRTRDLPAGSASVPVSLIVGWREESDDLQKSLHDALRKYSVTP